jgi:hypothetical protein
MVFTDEEIRNGEINHYTYNVDSFEFTITHFSHSELDYIQIKAYDSQWTDMYSTIVEIKYLTEYKLLIPDIKTLYDILQNHKITKVYEKKDHIVTYSVILEMGFNTIKIDFALEKDILNQEQVKDIKIDELTKRIELLENAMQHEKQSNSKLEERLVKVESSVYLKSDFDEYYNICDFIRWICCHSEHLNGKQILECTLTTPPTYVFQYNISDVFEKSVNLYYLGNSIIANIIDYSLIQKYNTSKLIDILNDLFEFNQTLFVLSIFIVRHDCPPHIVCLYSSYLYHIKNVQNIIFSSLIKKEKHIYPFGCVDYNSCGIYGCPRSSNSIEQRVKYNNLPSDQIQSHKNHIFNHLFTNEMSYANYNNFNKLYSISFEYK